MERCWDEMVPKIADKWDRLTNRDLAGVGGDFDRMVELIRQRYSPSRSKLSIEAEIRDWVVDRIDELEKGAE